MAFRHLVLRLAFQYKSSTYRNTFPCDCTVSGKLVAKSVFSRRINIWWRFCDRHAEREDACAVSKLPEGSPPLRAPRDQGFAGSMILFSEVTES
jgi:hypothetical protein